MSKLSFSPVLAAVTTNILTIKPPAWQKELDGTHHSEFGFFYLLLFLCDSSEHRRRRGKRRSNLKSLKCPPTPMSGEISTHFFNSASSMQQLPAFLVGGGD